MSSYESRTKVLEWRDGHSKVLSCQNQLQIPLYHIANGFLEQKILAIKSASSFLPYESLIECFMACVYTILTLTQVKIIINFFPKSIMGDSYHLHVIISPTTYFVTIMHWHGESLNENAPSDRFPCNVFTHFSMNFTFTYQGLSVGHRAQCRNKQDSSSALDFV